jgi:hypothetical protein
MVSCRSSFGKSRGGAKAHCTIPADISAIRLERLMGMEIVGAFRGWERPGNVA